MARLRASETTAQSVQHRWHRPWATIAVSTLLVASFGCARKRADDSASITPGDSSAGSHAAPENAELRADRAATATTDTPPANPGGMWTPSQLPAQAEMLSAMGYKLPAETLADPTQFPLGAVVSLGGCSGAFVSKQGLVVTNHHCVGRYLQHNSSAERNLLVDGFLANDHAQELPAGPSARVFVTTAFEDVTAQVLKGLDDSATSVERSKHLEDRREALEKTCEAGRPEVRCRVASYFEGAQFVRIEQLEIRDVRLVYVPHAGVGNYGGEIDNWRWPRHSGDFAFLRAYVGPDGKPADPSPSNRPYTPPHALKVSGADLDEGDFVMVVGYPGRTSRFRTADEVRYAVETGYPRRIRRVRANAGDDARAG